MTTLHQIMVNDIYERITQNSDENITHSHELEGLVNISWIIHSCLEIHRKRGNPLLDNMSHERLELLKKLEETTMCIPLNTTYEEVYDQYTSSDHLIKENYAVPLMNDNGKITFMGIQIETSEKKCDCVVWCDCPHNIQIVFYDPLVTFEDLSDREPLIATCIRRSLSGESDRFSHNI